MGYRQGGLRVLLALGLASQVAACGSVPRTAYTAEQAALASVPGIPGARVYADASVDTIAELAGNPLRRSAGFNYLALSGGGGDGAYGAGVLNGWTASGTRPEFTLVSGVSTGALIAPFAFLGPAYDAYLTEFYTSGVAGELVTSPSISNILFGSGLFGDGRLRNLIARYVTPELLTAIAEEHAKGRRLMVVTTNLDSQRSVIWNMGAIASSGAPNALDLFRDVLAASASVPAVFPPQMIDVTAADARFQEMHVDGSVVTPVFTLPQTLLLRDGKIRTGGKANIYADLAALQLAKAQVDAGKNEDALATLRAIKADPEFKPVIEQRVARLLVATGKTEDAIKQLGTATDSASLEIHGDALMAQGKRDAAREQYEKALKTLDVAAPQRRLLETKVMDAGGTVTDAAESV